MRKTIVLIEDQDLFRLVQSRVCREIGLCVVGETRNGVDAIAIVQRLKPDLVLVDLQLDGCSGFTVIENISRWMSSTRILIMSAHCDDMTVYRIESMHVGGFLHKSCDLNELKRAIKMLSDGRTYYSNVYYQIRAQRVGDAASFDKILSAREQEILSFIGLSYTDEEIALRLGISASTVKTHRKHLLAKLGYKTTSKLIAYARFHGFTKLVESELINQLSIQNTADKAGVGSDRVNA